MSYEKNNTGALFKNDKKETDSHPDYRGEVNIDGKEYYISSWLNTSKKGVKYMGLKFTAKEDVKNDAVSEAKQNISQPDPFDEPPF